MTTERLRAELLSILPPVRERRIWRYLLLGNKGKQGRFPERTNAAPIVRRSARMPDADSQDRHPAWHLPEPWMRYLCAPWTEESRQRMGIQGDKLNKLLNRKAERLNYLNFFFGSKFNTSALEKSFGHSFRGTPWRYQRLARSVKSHSSRNDQKKGESWNFFSAKCNMMRVRLHHSLKSPLCSCVSITLRASS